MIEEIELGGIKVPLRDLETTPESIKQVLKMLLEERKEIKQRIEELEEKLNKNSKNSSIPPSKNGFGVKTDNQGKAKKKPLKLTVARQKAERKLYAVEECETVHEEKPSNCRKCGYELKGEDPQPHRHQIVELPVLKPQVTEYRLHSLECEHFYRDGVEPTNNSAERALRPAVIWRNLSFGSQSQAGSSIRDAATFSNSYGSAGSCTKS